jgi:multidrug resistance efflux pump
MPENTRATLHAALLLTAALCAAGCAGAAEGERGAGGDLIVRRGDLRPRLLLTGELAAARAVELKVPRTPTWQVQIRWMAEDGSVVHAGDRVVELDNSSFTGELETKRAGAADATTELARQQAETRSTLAEKEWAVEQKRSDLAKAKLAAAVPQELIAAREYQDRQLALHRAEVELAKAERDLAAQREAAAADLEVQQITLRRSEREIAQAESAIEALILRAPRDGIILAAKHPWEGRKFREGDSTFVGMTVATLPDLSTLQVQAYLSDVDDGRIKPGMEAVCTLDAYPSESFRGRVVDISAVANESPRQPLLRSFPVQIRLDHVDAKKMRPGMSVRVEVLGAEVRGALLAPRAAIDFTGERPRVALAEGTARGGRTGPAKEIRLGPCDASFCVVEEGLSEGARLQARGAG